MSDTAPKRMALITLPNLVSLLRVVLIPAIAWAILNGAAILSLALFGVVVVSDVLDGFIARRTRQTSRFGTLLDHGADATFVISITVLCAHLGLLPWLLPPLIAIAFMQYVLDSHVLAGASLRPSPIGRWNGIAYFVVTGCAILVHHYARDTGVVAALRAGGWLLVVTTVISIMQRAMHRVRARKVS